MFWVVNNTLVRDTIKISLVLEGEKNMACRKARGPFIPRRVERKRED